MAAALGAEYCEICSDVDGVYTADPRVVPARDADRHAVVRGDAGARRIRREGAERAGGRVREGERDRDLRARDQLAAARRRSVGRRHGRPAPSAAAAGNGRRRRQRARRASCIDASDRDARLKPSRYRRARAARRARRRRQTAARRRRSADAGRVAREPARGGAAARGAARRASATRVRIADTLGAVSVVGAGINASFENVRRGSDALTASGMRDRRRSPPRRSASRG